MCGVKETENGRGVMPSAQSQGVRILTKTGSRDQRDGLRVLSGRRAVARASRLGVLAV